MGFRPISMSWLQYWPRMLIPTASSGHSHPCNNSFLSAFLLFMCQPMVGKMLLPYFGGAANVWTTCVLFFQFMLLLGYVYAHLLARVRRCENADRHARHRSVVALACSSDPIQRRIVRVFLFTSIASTTRFCLTTSTAIPFFVVSTTAPLLQNWFSRTTHSASSDPYFLYSASNAGSLLALIAYPFFHRTTNRRRRSEPVVVCCFMPD